MPSLASRFLVAVNRLFPAPALPGSSTSQEYAQWEYANSEGLVDLWRAAEGPPPRRILDLGCGLGGKTQRLVQEGGADLRVVAVDISRQHLRQAADYHRDVGVEGVTWACGDASHLPFRSGTFDHILTADTLEHFPRPRAALAEMRRCLAPDGRLVLLFNPWTSPRGSHLGDLLHVPWCQLMFSPATLIEATELVGETRARTLPAAEAERVRGLAAWLVDHFRDHLHPTRIGDLRRWVEDDGDFAVEREIRFGPGPLARWRVRWPDLLTASYGVVLRPR